MSFPGQSFHFPTSSSSELPTANDPDPRAPLLNLSAVRERMDSLQLFLTESINTNTAISRDQLDTVSAAISTAIRDVISNGSALISSPMQRPGPDSEIVEVGAAELVAEHFHYCEICGKGFKRDANLRMHMRAHGDRFKSPEALAKPESVNGAHSGSNRINTRFSCPYVGCNRNQWHARFQALKSVICVKNHFKRSHCPKMYTCSRCNDKRFSVVADLKSHQKHCGEGPKWRCTCGTRFSRKCKLFGHVTLFEGHMPEVEDDKTGGRVTVVEEEKTTPFKGSLNYEDLGFSEEFFARFGSIEGDFLEDMLVDL